MILFFQNVLTIKLFELELATSPSSTIGFPNSVFSIAADFLKTVGVEAGGSMSCFDSGAASYRRAPFALSKCTFSCSSFLPLPRRSSSPSSRAARRLTATRTFQVCTECTFPAPPPSPLLRRASSPSPESGGRSKEEEAPHCLLPPL